MNPSFAVSLPESIFSFLWKMCLAPHWVWVNTMSLVKGRRSCTLKKRLLFDQRDISSLLTEEHEKDKTVHEKILFLKWRSLHLSLSFSSQVDFNSFIKSGFQWHCILTTIVEHCWVKIQNKATVLNVWAHTKLTCSNVSFSKGFTKQ